MQLRKFVFHPFALLISFGIAGWILFSFYVNVQKLQDSATLLSEIESHILEGEKKVAVLEAERDKARSLEAKEAIIRDQLLLQKKGEYVVLVDVPPQVTKKNEPAPKDAVWQSAWEKWKTILHLP